MATTQRRTDVQGLRAIAVIAVICDHVLGGPVGGFVGVDVFFVVSGYLITGLLVREYERSGTLSFRGFYRRRIKRILPASMLVLLVTICASWVLTAGARFERIREDGWWTLFFGANWHFGNVGVDYFSDSLPPSPLQHYWSLAVEEQFYFVVPWLLLGTLVLAKRYRGGRSLSDTDTRKLLLVVLGGITVVSFAWALYETRASETYAYFSTFSRSWELGLGALTAVAQPWLKVPKGWAPVLGNLGLVAIVGSFFVVSAGSGFPAPWAVLPTAATVMVLAAAHEHRLLRLRAVQYVGDISFSLYLWHFPAVILGAAVWPVESATLIVFSLAFTLVASVLTYHYVEVPARQKAWITEELLPLPKRGPVHYLGFALALVLIAQPAHALVERTTTDKVDTDLAASETAKKPEGCVGAAALDPNRDCPVNEESGELAQEPADIEEDTLGAFECFTKPGQSPKFCDVGPKKAKTKVALVGDSHATAWLPGMKPQLRDLNWHVKVMTGTDCRPQPPGDDPNGCKSAMDAIQKELFSGKFDLAILSSSRSHQNPGDEPDKVIEKLRNMGTKVIVIKDAPAYSTEQVQCVQRLGFETNECGAARDDALSRDDMYADTAREYDVPVIDMTQFFCTEDECPAVVGNVIVYRDDDSHVTGTFSRTLGPYLHDRLKKAWRQVT